MSMLHARSQAFNWKFAINHTMLMSSFHSHVVIKSASNGSAHWFYFNFRLCMHCLECRFNQQQRILPHFGMTVWAQQINELGPRHALKPSDSKTRRHWKTITFRTSGPWAIQIQIINTVPIMCKSNNIVHKTTWSQERTCTVISSST